MAKHGRGLICLALTKKQIDRLKLPLMSQINRSRMQTAFAVSIEAKKGVSTGISAFDRAKTIKVAINQNSRKKDIVFLVMFSHWWEKRRCFGKSRSYRSIYRYF